MRTIAAAFTLFLACAAQAAGETYDAMSLVGDGLLVVRYRGTTGTSIGGNTREFRVVSTQTFDRTAVLAVEDAVRAADTSAHVLMLGGREPAALEAQSRAPGEAGTMQAIADALRGKLPDTGAHWLVLVTKGRHNAQFNPDPHSDIHVGSGSVEGLGYYIDPKYESSTEAGVTQKGGFIASFVALRLGLVDLRTGKVVAEQDAWATSVVPATESETLQPWDGITPERKIAIVNGLLKDVLVRSIPALLASR